MRKTFLKRTSYAVSLGTTGILLILALAHTFLFNPPP